MNIGDIVRLKHITDYEGIILSLVEWVQDELGENEIKIWKVFWYKHPYEEDPPHAGQYSESSLRIV